MEESNKLQAILLGGGHQCPPRIVVHEEGRQVCPADGVEVCEEGIPYAFARHGRSEHSRFGAEGGRARGVVADGKGIVLE